MKEEIPDWSCSNFNVCILQSLKYVSNKDKQDKVEELNLSPDK